MKATLPLCVLLLMGSCGPETDDDDTTGPPPGDCAEADLFEAEACAQTYCGAAEVAVGTGSSEFAPLSDGEEVVIRYGAQGGYHIDITAQMYNLCPIVYLVPSMHVDMGDGELVEIFTQNRHVQALRTEPDVSSEQQFWGIRGFVPCEYWPDDPDHDIECNDGGQGSEGHLEDFEVVIRMEAWDHNVGEDGESPQTCEESIRCAVDEVRVQPTCCE